MKLCWLDKIYSMVADLAVAAVSSLANVIQLATITKVQVKPCVEFRDTRPRVKCLQTKLWRRGCDDKGVTTVVFYEQTQVGVDREWIRSVRSWEIVLVVEYTFFYREKLCVKKLRSRERRCRIWSAVVIRLCVRVKVTFFVRDRYENQGLLLTVKLRSYLLRKDLLKPGKYWFTH